MIFTNQLLPVIIHLVFGQVIQSYRKVTTSECGIGGTDVLSSEKQCFKYHNRKEEISIHSGRNVRHFEQPWTVLLELDGPDSMNLHGHLAEQTMDIDSATLYLQVSMVIFVSMVISSYNSCRNNTNRRQSYYCPAQYFKVHIGLIDKKNQSPNSTYLVETIANHPDYDTKDYKNDISLVKLDRLVEFEQVNGYWKVNSICLPKRNYTFGKDMLGQITGWGRTQIDGGAPTRLLKTGWAIISRTLNTPDDDFGKYLVVKRYSTDEGSAICSGDSGGPLTIQDNKRTVLLGVASATLQYDKNKRKLDCNTVYPQSWASYMNVAYYVDWIVSVISNN